MKDWLCVSALSAVAAAARPLQMKTQTMGEVVASPWRSIELGKTGRLRVTVRQTLSWSKNCDTRRGVCSVEAKYIIATDSICHVQFGEGMCELDAVYRPPIACAGLWESVTRGYGHILKCTGRYQSDRYCKPGRQFGRALTR